MDTPEEDPEEELNFERQDDEGYLVDELGNRVLLFGAPIKWTGDLDL